MSIKDNPLRYIREKCDKYEVRKYNPANRRIYSFGTYWSIEDAIKVRDCLESVNWGFNNNSCRNIRYDKKSGKYVLQKSFGSEQVYWESFNTLEEAQTERDILESAGWYVENTNGAEVDNFKRAKGTFYKSEVGTWK